MLYHAGFFLISTSLFMQDGLDFKRVVENIPTDAASLFVYALLTLVLAWIVWGSRNKGTPSSGARP